MQITTSKKKLLVAGGSHSDIPMICAGQRLGFHVVTSGNNPSDIGHQYSDQVCLEDFSDKDALFSLAKKLGVDAICASSNDFSLISSSFVANQLNLGGYDKYEITLLIHHKDRFREWAKRNHLPIPSFISCSSYYEAKRQLAHIKYPAMIKPVDLTGGKGVSCVINKYEAELALHRAFEISKAKRIIIEDFINGTLHSFSTIVHNGKVSFYFGDNEYSYLNKFLVSTSASLDSFFPQIEHRLVALTERFVGLLNLVDGILHMQYLLSEGQVYIVEFTRRMPGDLYCVPVQLSTGVNYAEYIVKSYCGLDISDLRHKAQRGFYARHCVMSNQNGVFRKIYVHEDIQRNIIGSLPLMPVNSIIRDYMTQKMGIFFLGFSTENEMHYKIARINEYIYPIVQ